MRAMVPWLVLSVIAASARADDKSTAFEEHIFKWHGGMKMPYRLLKPEPVEPGKKYPLVLVLHGWGERGKDNHKQLAHFGEVFLKAGNRKHHPCFVVIPQADGSWVQHAVFDNPIRLTKAPPANLVMANEIVKTVMNKQPVDADRLYLTGFSNGACGLWELLEREPQVWAAAAPFAGAGDPAVIGRAKNVAIWAFHGERDKTIPIARMHELVNAVRASGGDPMYSIIPKGEHGQALFALNEPNLIRWMFAQRRGTAHVGFEAVAKPTDKRPTSLHKK
jgi:predicted peptidase